MCLPDNLGVDVHEKSVGNAIDGQDARQDALVRPKHYVDLLPRNKRVHVRDGHAHAEPGARIGDAKTIYGFRSEYPNYAP